MDICESIFNEIELTETTTAAVTAAVATSKQVVRADGQVSLLQEDAVTIRDGLDGSKSPAASASRLITNLLNGIALGLNKIISNDNLAVLVKSNPHSSSTYPLLASIEVSGEVLNSRVSIGLARKLGTALESTNESTGLCFSDALHASLIEGSSPR